VAQRAPRPGVPYPGNLFFSAVPRLRAELQVHRVRRCVLASAGRCIPLGPLLPERVRSALAPRCRLLERHVLEAVPVVRPDAPVSVTFRAG
jgi:hypothetical protein